jgi:phosphoglycolate phosphatase-like HAD superfamily hydrolase
MNLIVFDIDDTLTKSEYQHQFAFVNTMEEFGITRVNQNWNEYKHHTDSFILKENYERNLSEKFHFSFIENFESRMTKLLLSLKETTEINGAKDMVDYFSGKTDYAICFATGSFLKPALIKLKQSKISYEEKLVVGSNEAYEREVIVKQAIRKAREFHSVESFEHIISIGDGIWDLRTARNLGIHFIGIGMKNYADFKHANIKVHIKDWRAFNLNQTEQILAMKNTVANDGYN